LDNIGPKSNFERVFLIWCGTSLRFGNGYEGEVSTGICEETLDELIDVDEEAGAHARDFEWERDRTALAIALWSKAERRIIRQSKRVGQLCQPATTNLALTD
jgi:hypothetical protein